MLHILYTGGDCQVICQTGLIRDNVPGGIKESILLSIPSYSPPWGLD